MAKVTKPDVSFDMFLFATPEQRVLRFLMSEPTTRFTPRVLVSRLKAVRGLGGMEGLMKTLETLEALGIVEFLDSRRMIRVVDDHPHVQLMKKVYAICECESVRVLVEPVSSRGILFGVHSDGTASTGNEIEILVISESSSEVHKSLAGHPQVKTFLLKCMTEAEFAQLKDTQPVLAQKIYRGTVLWGKSW